MQPDMYTGDVPNLSKIYDRLSSLEIEVKRLSGSINEETRTTSAEKEYEAMERLRENYTPPNSHKGKDKCGFTIIGNKVICSQCYFRFDKINDYIPPYCPCCFAKREEWNNG